MRAYYMVLLASAFLASSEAFSPRINADQVQLSQPTMKHSIEGAAHRSLRTVPVADEEDDEERAWANIAGFDRTEAEAKEWLVSWLNKGKSVEWVAKELGVHDLPQGVAQSKLNYDALIEYQRMHFEKRTGYSLPKGN
uniref:RxLR effector protein n=1 Tax=Phytophthora agathidicida TaxID=1642459 RepID=A0A7G4WI56_9STRA|nr:PaRXLR67 [Phytophthora agathidicida]